MKSQKYRVWDEELEAELEAAPEKELGDWIILEPHPEYPGKWYCDGLTQGFFLDFEEQIGAYRTVSPATLQTFMDRADDLAYHIAFTEDPSNVLDAYAHLNDEPEFSLISDMEGTVAGMLPFQLQGFNYLSNSALLAGYALWSTGTGKTALQTALIKQHIEIEGWDLALVVVKAGNKVNTQRKLKSLGGLDSIVIDGPPHRRGFQYDELGRGEHKVAVLNYEKFRDDLDELYDLVYDRRVVVFWDEMPTKLSNRKTQLYESVKTVLYGDKAQIKWENRRPSELRQYALSATPIENDPVGLFNQVRLLDPTIFPTISGWEKRYGATRNYFNRELETFKNLDEFGLAISHMTHQVDKEDPDIAKMFPDVVEDVVYVEWDPRHRVVYEKLQTIAFELAQAAKVDANVKAFNAFQLIGVLQMICDAPSMVQKSAENREEFEAMLEAATTEDELADAEQYLSGSEAALTLVESMSEPLTDDGHTKIEKLREILTEKHPDEKVIVFSKLANYIQPVLTKFFDEWGVSYVVYRGTDKQRQEALDLFRNDQDIQVFLSSDAGSDSLDIPEASVVVHYDEPMKWTTKIQRQNRAHRVNSTFRSVMFYTLRMVNSVEDRIAEIIAKKKGFHMEVFKGGASEDAVSARMTADDLHYILTGEDLSDSI